MFVDVLFVFVSLLVTGVGEPRESTLMDTFSFGRSSGRGNGSTGPYIKNTTETLSLILRDMVIGPGDPPRLACMVVYSKKYIKNPIGTKPS